MTTLFFDTETTGLPIDRRIPALQNEINWPQLVSVSWSVWNEGECVKRETRLIKPEGWTIPADSTRIHGITTEMAEENGTSLNEALDAFKEDLMGRNRIIAHNMEFDKNVLFHAFAWHLGKYPRKFWDDSRDFCSQSAATGELKLPWAYAKNADMYKMPGLDELYKATFNEDAPPKAHSSARDVEVLEKIYWARWGLSG